MAFVDYCVPLNSTVERCEFVSAVEIVHQLCGSCLNVIKIIILHVDS